MHVATIVPTKYLHLIQDKPYHLCLIQEVLRDPAYREFYKRMCTEGKYVILDNGAAESENIGIEDIVRIQRYLGAAEIVLPDVFFDSMGTYTSTKGAMDYLKACQVRVSKMAVPQGHSIEEWEECALNMSSLRVNCIGIPKNLVHTSGKNARGRAINTILRLNYLMQKRLDVHLLGCWTDPREVGTLYNEFKGIIRGVDSGIAAMYTQAGLVLDPDNAPKPGENKPYLNFQGELDEELLKINIDRWEKYCYGMLQ